MSFSKGLVLSALAGFFLAGCASGYKARQEQRDKLTASTGLLCEFVNGDQHPDLDVELNMQMAKRCDINKPFTITNYRTSAEMNGIVYCCQVPNHRGETRESREREIREAREKRRAVSTPAAAAPVSVPVVTATPTPSPAPAPLKTAPANTNKSDEEVLSDQ